MTECVESIVPQTCSFDDLIIGLFKVAGFDISSKLMSHDESGIVVCFTCCLSVGKLNIFPLHQLIYNDMHKRNGTDRVLCFGLLNHDLGGIADAVIVNFRQTVYGSAYCDHTRFCINISATQSFVRESSIVRAARRNFSPKPSQQRSR